MIKKTALLMAIGALVALSSNAFSAALPMMHSPSTGNNYVAYTDIKTFPQADSFCSSKQGHLAVYNSNAELTEIRKYLELVPGSYWLGFTYLTQFGGLITVTGQTAFNQTTGLMETSILNPGEGGNLRFNADPNGSSLQATPSAFGSTAFICEFEHKPI